MSATKSDIIIEDADKVHNKLDRVFHDKIEVESLSGNETDFDITQSNSTTQVITDGGSYSTLVKTQMKLTQTVEQLISDMTAWKKLGDEEMKSLKVDLK